LGLAGGGELAWALRAPDEVTHRRPPRQSRPTTRCRQLWLFGSSDPPGRSRPQPSQRELSNEQALAFRVCRLGHISSRADLRLRTLALRRTDKDAGHGHGGSSPSRSGPMIHWQVRVTQLLVSSCADNGRLAWPPPSTTSASPPTCEPTPPLTRPDAGQPAARPASTTTSASAARPPGPATLRAPRSSPGRCRPPVSNYARLRCRCCHHAWQHLGMEEHAEPPFMRACGVEFRQTSGHTDRQFCRAAAPNSPKCSR
jgi:hypothetical protein